MPNNRYTRVRFSLARVYGAARISLMTNTASDMVNAALGAAGFIFENGYFARYAKTATRAVIKTSFIVPSADGLSFTSCTEDGATFTSTEEEILRAFPGPVARAVCGERSAN